MKLRTSALSLLIFFFLISNLQANSLQKTLSQTFLGGMTMKTGSLEIAAGMEIEAFSKVQQLVGANLALFTTIHTFSKGNWGKGESIPSSWIMDYDEYLLIGFTHLGKELPFANLTEKEIIDKIYASIAALAEMGFKEKSGKEIGELVNYAFCLNVYAGMIEWIFIRDSQSNLDVAFNFEYIVYELLRNLEEIIARFHSTKQSAPTNDQGVQIANGAKNLNNRVEGLFYTAELGEIHSSLWPDGHNGTVKNILGAIEKIEYVLGQMYQGTLPKDDTFTRKIAKIMIGLKQGWRMLSGDSIQAYKDCPTMYIVDLVANSKKDSLIPMQRSLGSEYFRKF